MRGGVTPSPQINYVGPSDALLITPCKPTPSGESLIDLAKAQNKNVSCISMYQKQLDAIKKNKEQQIKLFEE